MKRLLITGGSGFLGRHLGRRFKATHTVVLAGRSHDQNRAAAEFSGCETSPLDVSSWASVEDAFGRYRPHVVIHAAASKYVDIAEAHPLECIDSNVVGSENVARAAMRHGAELVVGISTDKACPPAANLYGMTKALMERLFCLLDGKASTRFVCTRLGNLPWSTGSAFPRWKGMAESGDHVIRSTGAHMTRMFTPIEEAAEFIAGLAAAPEPFFGGVVSPSMKAARILDVLAAWTRVRGGSWVQVDARAGERTSESLVAESERDQTQQSVVGTRPAFLFTPGRPTDRAVAEPVSSDTAPRFTRTELEALVARAPESVRHGPDL